jgi:hypothetical protein
MSLKRRIGAVLAVWVVAAIPAARVWAAEDAPRFPPLTVDKMTPEQKEAMGAIRCASGSGSQCTYDPQGYDALLLRTPGLEAALLGFAGQVSPAHEKTFLPAYLSQMVRIATARFYNNRPEWSAQVGGGAVNRVGARQAGTTEAAITAATEGKKQSGMKPEEAAVFDFTYELLHKHAVSDATFKKMVDTVGERGVLDAIGTITVWTFLCLTENVAEDNFGPLANAAPFPQATATGRPFR